MWCCLELLRIYLSNQPTLTSRMIISQYSLPPVTNISQFTTSYKYLGVEIDPTLNMNTNFDSTYKKASSSLRLLNKLHPFLTVKATKSIYQPMLLPTLTHCGILHLNQNQCQRNKLESFHRRAVTLIRSSKSVQVRSPTMTNKPRAIVLVRKYIDGTTCSNFRNYFEIASHEKVTRNNGYILKLPKLRLEYARGSFSYLAMWYQENWQLRALHFSVSEEMSNRLNVFLIWFCFWFARNA